MENKTLLTYTKPERNAYLVSMVGQNMIYNIVGTALAYYFQFVILIPAMAVGVIMTIARVWDGVNDFFMGTIVDKTRSKWGKCRPFLIYVPIPIMIITLLCFLNFGFYGESAAKNVLIVGWASVMYILWGMIYTIGDIPLWGVTALMTESSHDRNKLLSFARIAGGVGGGIVMLSIIPISLALGNSLTDTFGTSASNGERWGFFIGALIFAVIGTALFQICGFKIKERVKSGEKRPSLKENFVTIKNNKPFMQILLSGILGSPKMLIMLAAMPLINYYFATKDPVMSLVYMIVLGGGVFIGQFAGMALAPFLIKKYNNKKNLYNISNLSSALPYLAIFVVYLLTPRGMLATNFALIAFFSILFMVNGFFAGIVIVLQSSMIADCIDYEEHKHGNRPDGIFFAGQTFLAKLTSGIATILAAVAYAAVGFSDAAVEDLNAYIANLGPNDMLPREMAQYDNFMMILFFLVSVPPAIGCLLSVIPTWKYALNDDVHKQILSELNERRRDKELQASLAESDESKDGID
ncbi:MAG: glycoside-pentoside-hexuronide (GPH):cation symporter [Clostridia bacterium]|nr:glycoside-pentoside-hexuronide (GPH):cation symporter [Clostridia bacterium]